VQTFDGGGNELDCIALSPRASTPVFTDVKESDWYADAASYVMGKGLFDLTGASFKPGAPMTRLMLAEALWRLEGSPRVTGENPFADTDAPSVVWATDAEIVNGTGDGQILAQ